MPQGEADSLTQRCTQLHGENVHLSSMLTQRDNELQGAYPGQHCLGLVDVRSCFVCPTGLGVSCCRGCSQVNPPSLPLVSAAELEQTIEEKDGQLAAQKQAADKLAGGCLSCGSCGGGANSSICHSHHFAPTST